jgi:hypothetical protein
MSVVMATFFNLGTHHREIRRRNGGHLVGKQGKGEGHGERRETLEASEEPPLWAGETFYGRIKESVPCAVGDNDRERGG